MGNIVNRRGKLFRHNNITFEMWGFDDVHLQIPEETLINGERRYRFIQFIQGLHPRLVF